MGIEDGRADSARNERGSSEEARRETIKNDLRTHIKNLRDRADELESEFEIIVEARLRGDYDKRYDLRSET
jgi:hypothetical protein